MTSECRADYSLMFFRWAQKNPAVAGFSSNARGVLLVEIQPDTNAVAGGVVADIKTEPQGQVAGHGVPQTAAD